MVMVVSIFGVEERNRTPNMYGWALPEDDAQVVQAHNNVRNKSKNQKRKERREALLAKIRSARMKREKNK